VSGKIQATYTRAEKSARAYARKVLASADATPAEKSGAEALLRQTAKDRVARRRGAHQRLIAEEKSKFVGAPMGKSPDAPAPVAEKSPAEKSPDASAPELPPFPLPPPPIDDPTYATRVGSVRAPAPPRDPTWNAIQWSRKNFCDL
jgi:hypothetical protein